MLVQPGLGPGEALAEDRAALAAAGGGVASLRVWALAAPAVSLGRYHFTPRGDPAGAVRLARRLSGGRVWAGGPGWVGVTLALPRRESLAPGQTLPLRPEQVMNRAIRGVLRGLELGGVPALYPGRDLVTAGGRLLGAVAFEEDERGAVLCETLLAVGADVSTLARLLDTVDPEGVVTAPAYGAAETTSVAAVLGRVPSLAEIADWLARGHAAALGMSPAVHARPPLEAAHTGDWLAVRRPDPALDRRGGATTQLGVVECRFRVAGGQLAEVTIGGDLIAPSATMAALEAALVGRPIAREPLARAVTETLAVPGRFLLGVWPLDGVADAILAGA
jgi:lipoate-protein ligase A